jgi:hypothetical protein
MKKEKKELDFYAKNPDVFAAFLMEDGKLIFDFDEKKISISEVMIVLQNTVAEYLKVINNQMIQESKTVNQNKNSKE